MLGAGTVAAGGLLATAGIPSAQAGDTASGKPVPSDLAARRRAGPADRTLAAAYSYSGNYLLLHDGHPVLARSYGMADTSRSLPITPDTVFGLGSITKVFTGMAIGQLVQQSKIGYHEKLGGYLDGFAAEIADNVTIHHLLTHTSGLGDIYTEANQPIMKSWTSEAQESDGLLALVRAAPLNFTPGSAYLYSNVGFIVLQFVVAAVSGQTYYDYVRQHVFRPAGMASSDFYTRDQCRDSRRIAHPYAAQDPRSGGPRVDRLKDGISMGTGAGDAYSTVADMVAFVGALNGAKLLDAQHTWLATTSKYPVPVPVPPAGKPALYQYHCYAPLATMVDGHWFIGHSGGSSNGWSAVFAWYPDEGYVSVDLCNYGPDEPRAVAQIG
ncbi:serine hydrolase [Mangrovihabitans endophyticus]|uniref:Serine hydrolase n=2 Tax=Mangrovihabitans endophyticus TaxID=1751298 RepID=A0A8J3FMX4_9ACTN|nr:serine hydrolase [Mangrovihabitans endophyticus]